MSKPNQKIVPKQRTDDEEVYDFDAFSQRIKTSPAKQAEETLMQEQSKKPTPRPHEALSKADEVMKNTLTESDDSEASVVILKL